MDGSLRKRAQSGALRSHTWRFAPRASFYRVSRARPSAGRWLHRAVAQARRETAPRSIIEGIAAVCPPWSRRCASPIRFDRANRDNPPCAAALAHWWRTARSPISLAGGTWSAWGPRPLGSGHELMKAFRATRMPSRGSLGRVRACTGRTALVCAAAIAPTARYHGFNPLVGDAANGPCVEPGERRTGARVGIHGCPITCRHAGRSSRAAPAFSAPAALTTASRRCSSCPLIARRPKQPRCRHRVAPEWERLLSSAFIVDPRYGTAARRC